MRRDRRPYFIRTLQDFYLRLYTRRFLLPAFDEAGAGFVASNPWDIEIWGANIRLGQDVHINAARGSMVRLATWKTGEREGRIEIGDYALISPGVQIISSCAIRIGKNSMIASGCYISDSDWHDTYDRTRELDKFAPIDIGENVWLGVHVIVGKGVSIGINSIIGAGSVVTGDIPANCIAAGNPARILRELDPATPLCRREDLFRSLAQDKEGMDRLMRGILKDNTLMGWLRSLLSPSRSD